MAAKRSYLLALVFMLFSNAADAHTGLGHTHGFVQGFAHPLGGIDHVLAMVAVGLFAAHLGGRALWLVPASFVGMMMVAGALGAAGISLPFVETGIAVSVIALGLMVAFEMKAPVAAAMGIAAFFALFHGYAHGAEIPEDASSLAYAAGFVTATALLHAVGIAIGIGLGRIAAFGGERIVQLGGCGIALAGAAMLTGLI